jgi:hypothetical protein
MAQRIMMAWIVIVVLLRTRRKEPQSVFAAKAALYRIIKPEVERAFMPGGEKRNPSKGVACV